MKPILSKLADRINGNYAVASVVLPITLAAKDRLLYSTYDTRAVQVIGLYARTLGLDSIAIQTKQNGPYTVTIS